MLEVPVMKIRSLEIVILAVALCGPVSMLQGHLLGQVLGQGPGQGQGVQAGASSAPGGPGWIYSDALRGAPWVSIGDEGGQVFAHFNASCCTTRSAVTLFSAYSTLTTPVWTGMTRYDLSGAVDSATRVDVHVSAARQAAGVADPGPVRVWRWSSSGQQPTWIYTDPMLSSVDPSVGISSDGSLVVTAIARPGGSGQWDVVALDGATGVVLTQTTVLTASADTVLSDFALAGDGRFAVLRLDTQAFVVDVMASAVVLQVLGLYDTGGAVGISVDGRVLALADPWVGEVILVERTGLIWQPVYTWTGGAVSGSAVVEVSEDGSTVAAAFGGFPFPGNAIMSVALDVPTRTQRMYDVENVCCDIGYGPIDLEITPDGARFVVAVEGGVDFDLTERVLLYARDQDDALATWYTDAADVVDVALSPDGRLIAVGSDDPFIDGGGLLSLYRYSALNSDFRVEGAPQLGTSFDFVLLGMPHQNGILLASFAPAVPPLVLPGNGTLYLDPVGMQLRPMGPVMPDGSARLTVTLPILPALLGVAVWTQGLLAPELQLSNDWHKLTLLP
jgi:hypothetical protein